jgi:hypothetical protein
VFIGVSLLFVISDDLIFYYYFKTTSWDLP